MGMGEQVWFGFRRLAFLTQNPRVLTACAARLNRYARVRCGRARCTRVDGGAVTFALNVSACTNTHTRSVHVHTHTLALGPAPNWVTPTNGTQHIPCEANTSFCHAYAYCCVRCCTCNAALAMRTSVSHNINYTCYCWLDLHMCNYCTCNYISIPWTRASWARISARNVHHRIAHSLPLP